MIVKYNHPGVLVIGHKGGHIRLMPEVNQVLASDWDLVKDNPTIKTMLELGKLEVVETQNTQHVEDSAMDECPLLGMHYKVALKLVKETVDRDLLKKWQHASLGGAVSKAITEQLEKLTVKPSSHNLEASVG